MEGWICPRCGRANAPFNMTCDCVGKGDISYSDHSTALPHTPTQCIDPVCVDYDYWNNFLAKNAPISVFPKEESQIVVESKPNIDLASIIAPIRQEILELRRDLPLDITDKSLRDRQEGYNLAIDDVLELIDEETTDKTVIIEITNPFCKGNCDTCTMNCKRRG